MSATNRLALPIIDAAQAQKHVTHNEALVDLDALVHLSVKARNVLAAPISPAEGDRWLVGANATGAFAGRANAIAAFDNGGWALLTPRAGWRAFVEAENLLLVFDGANWNDLGLSLKTLQNLSRLGIGATADATNPLAAKLNGALLTARATVEGGSGDLRVTLNKSAAANTASQIYQTNYSGRAETGLAGDDHFHVKVSADGAAWTEAINIDPASGFVSLPHTAGVASGLASLDAAGKLAPAQIPATAWLPPPPRRVGAIVYQEAFETIGGAGWNALSANASLAADTTRVLCGVQSLALTSSTSAECKAQVAGLAVNLGSLNTMAAVRFYVPAAALAGLTYVEIFLTDAANVTYNTNVGQPGAIKAGWNEIFFPLGNNAWNNGTLNPANIARLIVGFQGAAGTTITFDRIMFFRPAATRGKILIYMDGSYPAQAGAAQWLEKFGKRMTFTTNQNYAGQAGYMTVAQLQALQTAGHAVIMYAGAFYGAGAGGLWNALTDAQKLNVVQQAQGWMIANGFSRGARALSINGASGWTTSDDANLLGQYLDFVTGGYIDGSPFPHITVAGQPYAQEGWWNGATTTAAAFAPVENFAAYCARAARSGGAIVFGAHINNASGDTLAEFQARMTDAMNAGLEFVTWDQWLRDEQANANGFLNAPVMQSDPVAAPPENSAQSIWFNATDNTLRTFIGGVVKKIGPFA
jgi:hypothetical protein